MTDAERNIFDLLCIDPKKLKVNSAAFFKQSGWEASIETIIFGEIISYPQRPTITLDDVIEQGIDILNHNVINVEHFNIHIVTDEDELHLYENTNTIEIQINCFGLPWLLKEKCNHKYKSPSKLQCYLFIHYPTLFNILANFSIKRFLKNYKDKKQLTKVLVEELEKLKCNFGVDSTVFQNKEIFKYKMQWVNSFLPKNADDDIKKQTYKICVKNKEYTTYLWHIFSYEIINSENDPVEEFDSVKKNNCTLFFETNTGNVAIKLSNAGKMKENDIQEFCKNVTGWCDFVVTADDFSWTYSRTHEDGRCGPYFYKKQA